MIPNRRRALNERSRRAKELEDSMNQKLEDLGLLEQGMTFKDKEDVLNIVRLSENTAQAEEQGRKSKINDIPSPGNPNSVLGDADENGEYEEKEAADCDDVEITQVYFPSDVVIKISGSMDEGGDQEVNEDIECPKASSKEDQKSYSLSLEGDSVENDDAVTYEDKSVIGNHEIGNHYPKLKACAASQSDNFSSLESAKEQEPTVSTQQNYNKEKSLDVFSYNQEPFLKTFCRSRLQKAQERIPFYLLQNGMDVHKYTSFFKCYVNEYLRRLYRNQRRRLEHLEWGPPICMEDSSVSDFKKQKLGEENDSSRRYNFRDRLSKPKFIDYASENSEEGEEESNDEDIFTPKSRKLPGIKLSSKRKISSTNDVVSPKKERKDVNFGLENKRLQDSQVATLSSKAELQQEEILAMNANDVNNCGVFNKKVPRSKLCLASRKRIRRQGPLPSCEDTSSMDLVENSAITSTTELEMPVCRDEHHSERNIELKPIALSAKHKKVLMTYDKSVRSLRRKTEVESMRDEVSNLVERETTSQELELKVTCPICCSVFPANSIEEHASNCNQYHPDTSGDPSELDQEK